VLGAARERRDEDDEDDGDESRENHVHMVLEFLLLGPFEVRKDDRVLELPRKKQRALLAMLALHAGRPVSTDRLVDGLWAQPPKGAKHALETYVSELRKTLGRETIVTRPPGYLLDADPDQVDTHRFARLVAEARLSAPPGERAERLRHALALVRGPALGDLAFEPFADGELARLTELELGAREELAAAELELGRHVEVVAGLEPLVTANPYRERLRALLMLALYRSGRQAEALAAYQDARSVLVDELGIDPGEELQELQRAILRQDPDLRVPQPETEPAPMPVVPAAPRAGRKTVTILSAGLVNAADLSDRLDPERLRAVFDRFADLGRKAVSRHGGTWQTRAGHAAQAVFGVPLAHEDDALRAVRAAIELREGVSALNDGLLPEHGVFLELRTALDTGEVLVQPESDDLATGRAVTGAEELERRARPGQILLGEETYRLVRETVAAEPAESDSSAFRLVELLPDAHGRSLRLDSPLVGRRRQLASLASAFESAVSDRVLHLYTVLGPAGVGKSRLVEEFLESLGDVATVLRGRCLPYGEVGLQPLRDAGLGDVEHEGAHERLIGLARERPVVLAIDDLQWADAELLDLLENLAESVREAPIVLVCTARPELLEQRPTWGGGKPNASSILLEPLSEAESERLIDNLLGESDLPGPVRDYLVRTSEGNPLFVEELLAMLVERDILRREAGRWTTTEVPKIPIPPTIQALVASRIDRLPDAERTVLELASVEGKLFGGDTVAALAPAEVRDDVDALLAALVRKELVRPRPDDPGGFSFRHQLIRDAAYASMPMSVRATLHEQLARLIPGDAAHQLAQAERYRAELGDVSGA
jgi:DNA-binding SARP family transcriptional activator